VLHEGDPVKEKEEEPKPIATPGRVFEDVIFEQIEGSFLQYDRATQQTSIRNLIVHEETAYKPLEKIPWPTASLPEVPESEDPLTKEQLIQKLAARRFQGEYGDSEHLFNEVKAFFMEHLDVRNELLYDVYAAFVLMTWRTEDFKVVPYQMFLGPLASGKTRGLECFRYLAYRALSSVTMSAASIFRSLEIWHCTLLLDETEVYGRESMIEVLALLNAGYRRGQYAIRIEKLEGESPTIAMFDTFGPKVLAGTEELAATLQSRAILTTMSRNVKHVRLFIDEEKAQDLRNKLLLYRFRELGHKNEFDVSTLNGYFSNSRVIELFLSLLEVAPTEEVRDRLIQCMHEITQARFDEEQVSIEATVFEAILNSADQVESGKLSVRTVTERFNVGLPEKEQVTARFIGRKVTALGFEKCKLTGGLRGFYWNVDLVERLRARYYPKTTPQTPQTQLTPLIMEKEEEKEEVSSGVNGETPSMLDAPGESQNTMKSGVSGEIGVSGVNLEGVAKNTLSLERLIGLFEDKCVTCGFQGRMDWQVNKFDNSWGLLCDRCGLELEKRLKSVDGLVKGAVDVLNGTSGRR
jgi:hypothetical protein